NSGMKLAVAAATNSTLKWFFLALTGFPAIWLLQQRLWLPAAICATLPIAISGYFAVKLRESIQRTHMNYSDFALRLQPSAIRAVSKAIHGKKVVSFAGGMPHASTFPGMELADLTAEILHTHAAEALQYGQTQGY